MSFESHPDRRRNNKTVSADNLLMFRRVIPAKEIVVKSIVVYGGLALVVTFGLGIALLSPRRSRKSNVSDESVRRLQEQFRSLDAVWYG